MVCWNFLAMPAIWTLAAAVAADWGTEDTLFGPSKNFPQFFFKKVKLFFMMLLIFIKVRQFINILYTGIVPIESDFNNLFLISDKYKVDTLTKHCLKFCCEKMSIDNCNKFLFNLLNGRVFLFSHFCYKARPPTHTF